MSYGVQRNTAERLAAQVNVYGSYEALFKAHHFGLEGMRATRAIRRTYAALLRVLRPAVEELKAYINGIDWSGIFAAEDEDGEGRGKEL